MITATTPPAMDLRIPAEKVVKSDSFDWREMLIVSKSGNYTPNLANCLTALRLSPDWKNVLAFDEFKKRVVALRPAPWNEQPKSWDDNADRLTCQWLQQEGINVKTAIAGEAVQVIARNKRIHPLADYLRSLTWDGDRRLDTWLTEYLGVSPGNYTAAVGAKWVIGGVARILRPGAKVDCMMVLEGLQGAGKSSALRCLARRPEWFTDELAELGTKDATLQLAGRWIIEIAELAAMHRATVEKIKGFISRQSDNFRPPYGRHVEDTPRQCIFAGSTNASEYLLDETGNRRFWPIRCGEIRLDELERDADQLWAEAVVRFNEGSKWWLTGSVAGEAAKEASERYQGDPWTENISKFIAVRESVSVAEVLQDCIGKPKEQWTRIDQNRVARTLIAAGWERFQVRSGVGREWRYQLPASP